MQMQLCKYFYVYNKSTLSTRVEEKNFKFFSGLYIRRIMVLFDKLSFSQVVGIFQAFKLYYERSISKPRLAAETSEESEEAGSDMECSLCINEPSKQIPEKELPR